jgi:RimJ/RimL family protein N-acetyltransferase
VTRTYQTLDATRRFVDAVPDEPADELTLASGLSIRIRPLSGDDREGFMDLFARLGADSRYRRYLAPMPVLSARAVTYLVDIDHITHEAFAAIDLRDGSIAGVGRYAQEGAGARVADIALEVADELQGMGIGTALARRVVASASEHGFRVLTATTLWENRPARALLRRLEFRARASRGPMIELGLLLERPTAEGDACA